MSVPPRPGFFLTFEGGEGAGKSTQIRYLAAQLEASGEKVVLTREPGGAPGAEAIRALLTTGASDRWDPAAEVLLFYAARAEHLARTIRPALARGAIVLCDRFSDSTRAYQGAAQGVDPGFIEFLDQAIVADTQPDLTILLDIAPEAGLARATARGALERFEQAGLAFHQRLRAAYLALAAANPERIAVIDAAGAEGAIAGAISQIVAKRLAARTP
ncbi:MAG: dTMP kinase [Alphaproteobacteria bacterium]|nr:dTMP kinase [Alphaproteobacteria bacterium]